MQPSKTEPRGRYSTMPGLESSFWHGIRFRKSWLEKRLFRPRKVFSGAGLPDRAKGQIFQHGRAWVHFGVALGCRGGKKLSGPESLFLIWTPETRPQRQDKPRKANTSQGQLPRSDDLQWVRLVSGWSCRRQLWWLRKSLNLSRAAPRAWKFRGT